MQYCRTHGAVSWWGMDATIVHIEGDYHKFAQLYEFLTESEAIVYMVSSDKFLKINQKRLGQIYRRAINLDSGRGSMRQSFCYAFKDRLLATEVQLRFV